MEWLSFAGVSWLGVVVAFVVSFVFGWLWYSPLLFFPVWSRLGRLDEDKLKNANMGAVFGQMIVGNVIGVIGLAFLMAAIGASGVLSGLVLGLIVGLAFRAGAHMVHNGFAQRAGGITLIDSAHDTIALMIAGLVLGLFM
ncbi:DUF1761 domain-containing protein [Demequina capsici]|uniref:DUF1761 domain-containing protein n=1 Tax=Demequina capsici TaxID=3075620 RepID=A0AA96F6B0_9MICO|nr:MULTISPECIES: DUF1761 domain-containing protein [unclassified Demequina]WNM23612.1 DUF1761 domain-containing protein [Demequina sp. OYTSA14]WNM26450.1 DUF1761 domain-containing protein [Demequina sp. PMTSA13]